MRLVRHRRPSRAFLALAGLLWIWAFCAQQIHGATVVHVVCPEHGEVTELAPGGAPVDHATISALPDGEHHDGCALPAIAPALLPTALAPLHPQEAPELLPSLRPILPDVRGPPLTYAPKTSPPV